MSNRITIEVYEPTDPSRRHTARKVDRRPQGFIAVHRGHGRGHEKEWVLTHRATGLAFAYADSLDKALGAADAIEQKWCCPVPPLAGLSRQSVRGGTPHAYWAYLKTHSNEKDRERFRTITKAVIGAIPGAWA